VRRTTEATHFLDDHFALQGEGIRVGAKGWHAGSSCIRRQRYLRLTAFDDDRSFGFVDLVV
jgi:hypothetical protein